MFVIRGVNVYPGEIDIILSSCKNVGSEYQIILERRDDGKDYMTIKVEREEGTSATVDPESGDWIYNQVRQKIMVSPIVKIVDYNELPRSERKTKRIFDNREI